MLVEVLLDVLTHRDLRRRDEGEPDVAELAEEVRERPNGASVGEVADHGDPKAVDVADLIADRVQVEQRLRRVLARSVPRVDHGHAAHRGRAPGGALLVVT